MNVGLWTPGTRTRVEALENQNALIGDLLQPGREDVLLEAGCGTGGTSIWLSRRFGARAVGITLCERQAAKASEYARSRQVGDRVKFAAMDYAQAALPDRSFTGVFASESVCHAEHKERFITEAFRLLRPGGRLAVLDAFLPTDDLSSQDKALLADWYRGWAVPNLATIDGFRTTIAEAGFESVAFRDLTDLILPSVRRLYAWGLVGAPAVRLLRAFGLSSPSHLGHAIACRRVHPLVSRGVCRFGAFSAKRPD